MQELRAQELWRIDLGRENQHISNVVAKHPSEHVHSQGVVLGDRSVQYKYLNPNLVLVTTEETDNPKKGQYWPVYLNSNLVLVTTEERGNPKKGQYWSVYLNPNLVLVNIKERDNPKKGHYWSVYLNSNLVLVSTE